MLKITEITEIGIPVSTGDAYTELLCNSAFDWLKTNTTLVFDTDDINSMKALPPTVKLFVLRFCDIMSMGVGVTHESIGQLSHSFDTGSKSALIWQYARELLNGYLKSQVKVFTAKKKWR